MERIIEIEKSEYDRLKSREEKYLAYMDMLSYRGEDKTEVDALCGKVAELEKENKRLKKFKEKLEENRFYFKAQMEMLKPKTVREAEDLQRAKKTYEELYMKELRYLEKEIKKQKEEIEYLENFYSK